MAYPIRHKLLTISGDCFGGSEEWSFGLRIIPPIDSLTVSQAQVDAIYPLVSTFWISTSSKFSSSHRLVSVKLAPIATNGRYPDGEVAVEHVYGTPPTGGTPSGGNEWPPQCAYVITLLTAAPRGRGSKGRVYLPPLVQPVDTTTGLIPDQITAVGATFKTMVNAINALSGVGTVGVVGKTGEFGSSRAVTGIRLGRVVDTQRRRRRSLAESATTLSL